LKIVIRIIRDGLCYDIVSTQDRELIIASITVSTRARAFC